MPTEAHPVSYQREHSPLPEVDTSLFNPSFELESPQQESPFNVADLLAGLLAHGPLLPSAHITTPLAQWKVSVRTIWIPSLMR